MEGFGLQWFCLPQFSVSVNPYQMSIIRASHKKKSQHCLSSARSFAPDNSMGVFLWVCLSHHKLRTKTPEFLTVFTGVWNLILRHSSPQHSHEISSLGLAPNWGCSSFSTRPLSLHVESLWFFGIFLLFSPFSCTWKPKNILLNCTFYQQWHKWFWYVCVTHSMEIVLVPENRASLRIYADKYEC